MCLKISRQTWQTWFYKVTKCLFCFWNFWILMSFMSVYTVSTYFSYVYLDSCVFMFFGWKNIIFQRIMKLLLLMHNQHSHVFWCTYESNNSWIFNLDITISYVEWNLLVQLFHTSFFDKFLKSHQSKLAIFSAQQNSNSSSSSSEILI